MNRRSVLKLLGLAPVAVSAAPGAGASATDDGFTPITPCGPFINERTQQVYETVRICNPDDPDQYVDVRRVKGLRTYTRDLDLTAET